MSEASQHHRWLDRPSEIILGGITRRFITSERIMIGQVMLRRGDVVPEHTHPNEQFTFVVEGAMHFWLGDNIDGVIVRAGEVIVIPSDMTHRAIVLEDTLEYDIFNPPRTDWMDAQNPLLRD
ncbi:cupin domain-containing protein [Paraburkholderia hospita]|uniref:cupin domain-containing protein n=1 Tax=Paraburkholderia hospita TaxID=169430 RepID=UPI001F3A2939|nr:cupin domain-containing protein [Paraburkholderia hospita]